MKQRRLIVVRRSSLGIHDLMIFEQTKQIGTYARTGVLHTRAGSVTTPTFMPDGTRGAVKSLTPQQVVETGVGVVLANTYHLHLAPGEDVIKHVGGLHAFANRPGPILTDSGGFQVFSLGDHTKVTEEGVHFKDPKTGSMHFISPEKSMQIQLDLGADMIVAFDHLVGLGEDVSPQMVKDAFDRTHRWLERCIIEFKRLTKDMIGPENPDYSPHNLSARGPTSSNDHGSALQQKNPDKGPTSSSEGRKKRPLLFGVVQGGLDIELRKESLRLVQESDVDGIAIGGLSVGETREEMQEILEALAPLYDPNRPRFLLGVGTPEDLKIAVENGIDMLDCVLPTRNARHGSVWRTRAASHLVPASADPEHEVIRLTNEKYAADTSVIEDGCDCYACINGFSKAFLRHQLKVGEPLAGTLASIHNLRYMLRLCEAYQV